MPPDPTSIKFCMDSAKIVPSICKILKDYACICHVFLLYYRGALRKVPIEIWRIDRVAKELAWKASKV